MTRILLVDDDETVSFAMGEVLRGRGYDVECAHNGNKAIELLKASAFDLVLLDIFMPEKDGIETIGDIRRRDNQIKIIAMSGQSGNKFDPLEYARSLGANDALAKPFSADELIASIRRLVS